MENKRCGNISNEQKKELLEFLEKHPELKSGKFTSNFTFKKAQVLWQQIGAVLNSFGGGAHKDWKQWRKTWHDMKTLAKSKHIKAKRSMQKTGGGSQENIELTEIEEQVLDLIGPVAVEGDPNIKESLTIFSIEESQENEGLENKNPSSSTPTINEPNIYQGGTHQINTPNEKNESTRKKYRRVQRLENTINASQKLVSETVRQNNIRENYLKRKLELYEEEIEVKRRIAVALEKIAENL